MGVGPEGSREDGLTSYSIAPEKPLGSPSPATPPETQVPAELLVKDEPGFMSNYSPCKIRWRRRCLIRLFLNLGFL